MSEDKSTRREERLMTRLKKARLGLTEEELQFFPKTSSMPDQPRSHWMPSEKPVAGHPNSNLDSLSEVPDIERR